MKIDDVLYDFDPKSIDWYSIKLAVFDNIVRRAPHLPHQYYYDLMTAVLSEEFDHFFIISRLYTEENTTFEYCKVHDLVNFICGEQKYNFIVDDQHIYCYSTKQHHDCLKVKVKSDHKKQYTYSVWVDAAKRYPEYIKVI